MVFVMFTQCSNCTVKTKYKLVNANVQTADFFSFMNFNEELVLFLL